MADRGLTPKQQRFIQEYTVDLNGTQAAIRAGYSPKTARSIASETLQRPAVKMAIQKALRANVERLQMLTAVAFADPRDAIKWDPELGLVVTTDRTSFRASAVSRARIRKLGAHVGSPPSSLSIGRGPYWSSGDAWDVSSCSDR